MNEQIWKSLLATSQTLKATGEQLDRHIAITEKIIELGHLATPKQLP
jgi:hypothetical protein